MPTPPSPRDTPTPRDDPEPRGDLPPPVNLGDPVQDPQLGTAPAEAQADRRRAWFVWVGVILLVLLLFALLF